VESKIRQLVSKLEMVDHLARIHPFVKGFDKTYYTINMQEHGDIVLGNLSPAVANRTEEEAKAQAPDDFQAIYTTTYYIGLEIARLDTGTS
jgi:poly(A) polymerase